MSKSIYYYSGPVHAGKTTRLIQWVNQQKNVDGILAPIIDGYRYLQVIGKGESRQIELDSGSVLQEVVTIGQYTFSENVFSWARKQLLEVFSNNPEWLIIDEIGPLELRNQGLEPAVTEILRSSTSSNSIRILLVIRERILSEVLQHYKIETSKQFEFPFNAKFMKIKLILL